MQGHLFESPIAVGIDRALRAPVAAKNDPATSREAAEGVTRSGKRQGQCMGILALVKKYPDCTSFELSRKPGVKYDRFTVAKRLPNLEEGGLIFKSGTKVCGVSGHKACTWKAI